MLTKASDTKQSVEEAFQRRRVNPVGILANGIDKIWLLSYLPGAEEPRQVVEDTGMLGTIRTRWRISLRLIGSGAGSTAGIFLLAVLLRATPGVAQNAAPPEGTPAPPSYGTTWTRGAWPSYYHPVAWQVSPAAPAPSSAAGVVMRPGPALTVPNRPAPSGIILISAKEKAKDTDPGDGPALFGKPEVFRLESERHLRERAQAEAKAAGKRPLPYPTAPTLPLVARPGPSGTPTGVRIEPTSLCYDRLMFEEKNSERYGWELGPIGALVSPTDFYWKVLTAPLARLVDPCRSFEANAGYCLPGDPVPYLLRLPCSGGSR